jgi:hypothetical protein
MRGECANTLLETVLSSWLRTAVSDTNSDIPPQVLGCTALDHWIPELSQYLKPIGESLQSLGCRPNGQLAFSHFPRGQAFEIAG